MSVLNMSALDHAVAAPTHAAADPAHAAADPAHAAAEAGPANGEASEPEDEPPLKKRVRLNDEYADLVTTSEFIGAAEEKACEAAVSALSSVELLAKVCIDDLAKLKWENKLDKTMLGFKLIKQLSNNFEEKLKVLDAVLLIQDHLGDSDGVHDKWFSTRESLGY